MRGAPEIINPDSTRPPWTVHIVIDGRNVPVREPGTFNGGDCGMVPAGLLNAPRRLWRAARVLLFGQPAVDRLRDEVSVLFDPEHRDALAPLNIGQLGKIAIVYQGRQRAYYEEWSYQTKRAAAPAHDGTGAGLGSDAVEVTPENAKAVLGSMFGFAPVKDGA